MLSAKSNYIYFDTNIFVYFIEGVSKYQSLSSHFFDSICSLDSQVITSDLTICECLVQPKISNNKELEDFYIKMIFYNTSVRSIPISKEILIKSAEVRAKYRIKAFDAIHIATAIVSGCSSIVTNDKQFKMIEELKILYLDDFLN